MRLNKNETIAEVRSALDLEANCMLLMNITNSIILEYPNLREPLSDRLKFYRNNIIKLNKYLNNYKHELFHFLEMNIQ